MKQYLITNLPQHKFSSETVKNLYYQRWEIEASFLFLKYRVDLNFFHSFKRPLLNQENFAKMIMYYFISLTISYVEVPFSDTK